MANIEPLRPFQAEDVPYFLGHLKSMILYEPRLGKTVVSCQVLGLDPKTSSVLIACSKNAMSVWLDHIQTWLPHLKPGVKIDFRIMRGKGGNASETRRQLWSKVRDPETITVYLVTFQALFIDRAYIDQHKIRFDTIIADEVHTRLRNRTTKTTEQFKHLVEDCRRFHALSGTLVGKWGPADYWNLLNIINRREFSSYWKFVGMFCHVVDGPFGKEIIGVRNREAFHKMMERFAKFRDRKTYAPQMPTVTRDRLRIEMTPEQKKVMDQLGASSFAMTPNGGMVVARNSLEGLMRKRQLLACPKILDPTMGYGAAMEDILDRLEEAKAEEDKEGQHIVIFSALRKALPWFEQALRSAGWNNIYQLVGGTEPEDLVKITKGFRDTKGIMLCTTQFAQAFSLDSSHVCYHIGWDFDPNNNKQAEDRLVAQVGAYGINSWYYVHKMTVDEPLSEVIVMKSETISITNTDPRKIIGMSQVDQMYLPGEEL